ncbi:uncharacterized protein K444DRAFT_21192 [Hyaloscypha bicolor E]|uniref:Uncharacterized protein n=1 Tax=Hyaloscypha bicolor E TaxID=1095630 RepID=A0A2J6T4W5_9HELO|nr:uncharacterized protein K444DRAFT_21192 [Hyaloscypha bicolor E]PMD58058.1 hypothetical protein K444DRAFT_21192 [Hyaloscypha bicolor E]
MATCSEIILFVFNWVFYGIMAASIAALVAFHQDLHSHGSKPKKRHTVRAILRYAPVVLGGIPWIMVNGDYEVGLKRPRSWLLILVLNAILVLSLATLGSATLGGISDLFNSVINLFRICGTSQKKTAKAPPPTLVHQEPRNQSSPSVGGNHASYRQTMQTATGNNAETQAFKAETYEDETEADVPKAPSLQETDLQVAMAVPLPDSETESVAEVRPKLTSTEPLELQTSRSALSAPSAPSKWSKFFSWKKFKKFIKNIWEWLGHLDFSNHKSLYILTVLNLISLVWSVLAIELMIRWNNITEVYTIQSVGQLIPFVIGIVGFLKLVRDVSVERTALWIYSVIMESLLDFDRSVEADSDHPVDLETLNAQKVRGGSQKTRNSPVGLGSFIFSTLRGPRSIEDKALAGESSPILLTSIGDQIITVLQKEADRSEESIRRTNARLALSIMLKAKDTNIDSQEGLRKAQKESLEELHNIDINPHELAVAWLKEYMKAYEKYVLKRREKWKQEKARRRLGTGKGLGTREAGYGKRERSG